MKIVGKIKTVLILTNGYGPRVENAGKMNSFIIEHFHGQHVAKKDNYDTWRVHLWGHACAVVKEPEVVQGAMRGYVNNKMRLVFN